MLHIICRSSFPQQTGHIIRYAATGIFAQTADHYQPFELFSEQVRLDLKVLMKEIGYPVQGNIKAEEGTLPGGQAMFRQITGHPRSRWTK